MVITKASTVLLRVSQAMGYLDDVADKAATLTAMIADAEAALAALHRELATLYKDDMDREVVADSKDPNANGINLTRKESDE